MSTEAHDHPDDSLVNRVRALIAIMREGNGFPETFQELMGVSVQDFEGQFRRNHGSARGENDGAVSSRGRNFRVP